jgi:glycosidase
MTQAIKAQHPNAVLLGEVWDPSPARLKRYYESGFDALFDFPGYLALSNNPEANGDGVLNGTPPVNFVAGAMIAPQRVYPPGAGVVRFLSNHDTNRIASDVEGDPRRMRLAAALTYLAPGIPIVYYGEEIGMRGSKGGGPVYDEYRREPMDWYAAEAGPGMTTWFKPADRNNAPDDGISVEEQEADPESLLAAYRELARLRAVHPALRSNDYHVMDAVAGCSMCLGIWRWADDEVIALFFNFSGEQHTIAFNAAEQAPVPIGSGAEFILGGSAVMDGLVIEPWATVAMRWPAP